ncbi:MAG TPA: replication initiator [Acidimicrobiales bacterium]|nr:replication initiator [Acidimicrobiales bacterium]
MDAVDQQMLEAIARRVRTGTLDSFLAQGQGCGWCRRPVRLRGAVVSNGGGGRRLAFTSGALPDGVVLKACGSRRETRCPACATVYRDDARHLVRAGLLGGKGVEESVALHPAVFLTLTAPSFGPVHSARDGQTCQPRTTGRCHHGRPVGCHVRHGYEDEIVGAPLCPDCYGYDGAVLHNAATSELWRRTTIYVLRHLAAVLGITQKETRRRVRLSFCRVAELQRRGLVHLHAVVRADHPDSELPDEKLPDVSADQLSLACIRAARAVTVSHPLGVARWGGQLDVQVLDREGDRARKVAAYVAKYATKSSDDVGALDRPIASEADLAERDLSPHLRRMVTTAWRLGGDPGFAAFNLRQHAHTLGYGGHFLTKSRRYSTTFAALRGARADWQAARRRTDPLSSDRSELEAHWRPVGFGWANRGEAWFAGYQHRNRMDERRTAAEDRYSTTSDACS